MTCSGTSADNGNATGTTSGRSNHQRDRLASELDHIDGGDRERRFLRQVSFTYDQLYPGEDDRRRFPYRAPILGEQFLDSVDRLQGVDRQKILEVAAHVCCHRAWEIKGYALHQVRGTDAPDAPVQVRADGATAWRAALQVKTTAARRLHFWQLPDGTVELAKVGIHDDFEMA